MFGFVFVFSLFFSLTFFCVLSLSPSHTHRLADVSCSVGRVLCERLLDLARAQIIRVCWWLENGGNPHAQHTADLCLLLRLMRLLSALSERTAPHWILNDAVCVGGSLCSSLGCVVSSSLTSVWM
jgi:hypothetical protein